MVVHSESVVCRYCSSGAGYAWKPGQSGEFAVIKVYSRRIVVALAAVPETLASRDCAL